MQVLEPSTHKTPTKVVNAMLGDGVSMPITRQGWHEFYKRLYEKRPTNLIASLACWHYLMLLAFGETPLKEIDQQTRKELAEAKKSQPSMFAVGRRVEGIRDSWKA